FTEHAEEAETLAKEVTRAFRQPVVIKPVDGGSSLGVTITGGYAPVRAAIEAVFESGARGVLVEERVRGTEATVAVVEGLRGEALYALPPVEIIPYEGQDFFTYSAKYEGKARELCPGRFSREVADELMHTARLLHTALDQRHYSRSDFIV